ncbi:hypothetical protein BH23BAC3_BH23BAC3_30790 [soil metagenome]
MQTISRWEENSMLLCTLPARIPHRIRVRLKTKLEYVEYKINGPVYLGEQISISGTSVNNHMSELRICGPEKNIALSASVKWGYKW